GVAPAHGADMRAAALAAMHGHLLWNGMAASVEALPTKVVCKRSSFGLLRVDGVVRVPVDPARARVPRRHPGELRFSGQWPSRHVGLPAGPPATWRSSCAPSGLMPAIGPDVGLPPGPPAT